MRVRVRRKVLSRLPSDSGGKEGNWDGAGLQQHVVELQQQVGNDNAHVAELQQQVGTITPNPCLLTSNR